jgi:hypothetical protein
MNFGTKVVRNETTLRRFVNCNPVYFPKPIKIKNVKTRGRKSTQNKQEKKEKKKKEKQKEKKKTLLRGQAHLHSGDKLLIVLRLVSFLPNLQ